MAILHLGTMQEGGQNIYIWFPKIKAKDMRSFAMNEKIIRVWNDDIMNSALRRTVLRVAWSSLFGHVFAL